MKKVRKMLFYLALAVCIISVPNTALETHAASKVKLNKKSVTLTKGTYVNLKVSGTKKAVKWSSKNKRIATVNKNGKVSAKKAGKTKIVAKVGNKKLVCTVKVVKQNTDIDDLIAETETGKTESSLCEHGYNSSSIKIQDATCETAGSVLVYCKICNKTLLEIPIEPKGHRISVRNQKDATYTSAGYTGDSYCEVCGKMVGKGTEIPPLTGYTTVKLTKDNFSTYFEITIVFSKFINNFGDIIVNGRQAYVLKPQYVDKVIPGLCTGQIRYSAKLETCNLKLNPESLTYSIDSTSSAPFMSYPTERYMSSGSIYIENGIYYEFSEEEDYDESKTVVPYFPLGFEGSVKIRKGTSGNVNVSVDIDSNISIEMLTENTQLCFLP